MLRTVLLLAVLMISSTPVAAQEIFVPIKTAFERARVVHAAHQPTVRTLTEKWCEALSMYRDLTNGIHVAEHPRPEFKWADIGITEPQAYMLRAFYADMVLDDLQSLMALETAERARFAMCDHSTREFVFLENLINLYGEILLETSVEEGVLTNPKLRQPILVRLRNELDRLSEQPEAKKLSEAVLDAVRTGPFRVRPAELRARR